MSLKTILGAATVAALLPFSASAATIIVEMFDGGTYDVSEADEFFFDETYGPAASGTVLDFTFTNEVYSNPVVLNAATTVLAGGGSDPDALGGFGSDPLDANTPLPDDPFSATAFSTILDPNEEITFFVRLGEITPTYNIDISVKPSPIPVPAAGFLLLGGLGGLALMRRRKTS